MARVTSEDKKSRAKNATDSLKKARGTGGGGVGRVTPRAQRAKTKPITPRSQRPKTKAVTPKAERAPVKTLKHGKGGGVGRVRKSKIPKSKSQSLVKQIPTKGKTNTGIKAKPKSTTPKKKTPTPTRAKKKVVTKRKAAPVETRKVMKRKPKRKPVDSTKSNKPSNRLEAFFFDNDNF